MTTLGTPHTIIDHLYWVESQVQSFPLGSGDMIRESISYMSCHLAILEDRGMEPWTPEIMYEYIDREFVLA